MVDISRQSYVPTLPFWTGGSRVERTTPSLPFLLEIFRFEMILALISNISDFFQVDYTFYKQQNCY